MWATRNESAHSPHLTKWMQFFQSEMEHCTLHGCAFHGCIFKVSSHSSRKWLTFLKRSFWRWRVHNHLSQTLQSARGQCDAPIQGFGIWCVGAILLGLAAKVQVHKHQQAGILFRWGISQKLNVALTARMRARSLCLLTLDASREVRTSASTHNGCGRLRRRRHVERATRICTNKRWARETSPGALFWSVAWK